MKIFSSRVYVICAPELVHSAFRIPKSLSFDPFVIESSRRSFNITKEGMKIIAAENEEGDYYRAAIHKSMYEALAPGPSLLDMNSRVLSSAARFLNEIGVEEQPKSLFRWTRDSLTLATADAVYGRHNPVEDDPKLIDSLW